MYNKPQEVRTLEIVGFFKQDSLKLNTVYILWKATMTVNFQVVNIISASVSRIKFVLSKLTVKYPQNLVS